jgi:cell division protein FtsB
LVSLLSRPRLRRRLIVLSLLALAVWVGLLDSHSLWRRVTYARELSALTEENRRIERENADLAGRVNDGLSPATVERVAREQYGMRRPGETVYPVVVDEEE